MFAFLLVARREKFSSYVSFFLLSSALFIYLHRCELYFTFSESVQRMASKKWLWIKDVLSLINFFLWDTFSNHLKGVFYEALDKWFWWFNVFFLDKIEIVHLGYLTVTFSLFELSLLWKSAKWILFLFLVL